MERAATRTGLGCALLAGAALGLGFGVLYPTTQVAIEPAQLLAGLLAYPPDNAFGIYETRVWTALHQLLAIPLALGVGERALSIGVSGLVGALSFASLSAFAFALGAPAAWAAIAPFLLWAMNPIGWGFGYPILLVGHPHTYGMVGLAWALLACSVIGAGRFAIGAALLGFAPALHVSIGASIGAIAGLAVLLGWRDLRPHVPALLRGGAIGAGLAGLSLAAHLAWRPEVAAADPRVIGPLFEQFLHMWDAHRQPVEWLEWRTGIAVLGVAVAAAWLWKARADAAQRLLLRVILISALFGALFAVARNDAFAGWMPRFAVAAMPTRILNLPVVVFVPLLIAAFVRPGASVMGIAGAAALAAIALLWQRAHTLLLFGLPLVGVAALVVLLHPGAQLEPRSRRRAEIAIAVLVAIGLGAVVVWSASGLPQRLALRVADRSVDAALAAASRRPGLLAVAPGVERPQQMTRRPIVIDPQALDMVGYAPAALPEMVRAIEGLYGVSFASPPAEDRNHSMLSGVHVEPVWEGRSAAEWATIGAAFDATDVLVPASWRLQLPEVARSRFYVLYSLDGARETEAAPKATGSAGSSR